MPQAKIIIGADNDQKKDKNAGLDAALEAAQAVGGVIALPGGKQGFSTDWNDIHVESGLDDVMGGIMTAKPPQDLMRILGINPSSDEKALSGDSIAIVEWGEPEPLTTPPISAPDFTENCMPKIIWDVSESAGFTAATSNIFSIPTVLEGVLLAMGGRVYVSRNDGSVRNLVTLYLANIAVSGEGKTATRRCLECEHVKQYMGDRTQTSSIELETWKDELFSLLDEKTKVMKRKAETGRDRLVKSNDIKEMNQLIADHHKKKPMGAISIMGARTPEALIEASENYHYIMVSTDEGSSILEGYGRYSGSQSADLNPDLAGYDGENVRLSRKGGGDYGGILRQGMNVSIQPSVADSILGDPTFSDRGLVQRFTWLASETTAGTLNFKTKRTRNAALMNEWGDYILKITKRLDAMESFELKLSKEADDVWAEYSNSIQKEIREKLLVGVESFFHKRFPSLILKVAALFHCVDHGCEGEIGISTMNQAISFCKVVKIHRLALLKGYSSNPERSSMLKLIQKLHESKIIKITARDLQRKGWGILKVGSNQPTVAEVDRILNQLVLKGYARIASLPETKPKEYEIHPNAIELAEPDETSENKEYGQLTTDTADKIGELPKNDPINANLSALSAVGSPYSFKKAHIFDGCEDVIDGCFSIEA